MPGFGAVDARLLIVGLAPAAHGANRTGRMFTGDRSGDVLYAALHAVGLASQPTSVAIGDGLELYGVRITAPVRCAPPENKPTPDERDRCRPWLARELALLRDTVRAVVVLGGFGWQALLPVLATPDPAGGHPGWVVPRPRPAFGHGAHVTLEPADPARRPRSRCSGATTSASRTPSPDGSPRRCSRTSSPAPPAPPAWNRPPHSDRKARLPRSVRAHGGDHRTRGRGRYTRDGGASGVESASRDARPS